MIKMIVLFLLVLFLLSSCGRQPDVPEYVSEEILEGDEIITEYLPEDNSLDEPEYEYEPEPEPETEPEYKPKPESEYKPEPEPLPIPNVPCFNHGNEEHIEYDFPLPLELVAQFFAEHCALATADAGYLWGRSLHTPFIFLHTETRRIVANQPDSLGILTRTGNVYTGTLPEQFPAMYSFPRIGDRQWAMLPWRELFGVDGHVPLRSMAHMSMHVHQSFIFGTAGGWDNGHMENKTARILIQLEANALVYALGATGEGRYNAIHDALAIRAERRRLFPGGARSENIFEVFEGLTDYTDIRMSGLDRNEIINDREVVALSMRYQPTLSGIFGYVTGSLYGFLLDEVGSYWRGDVRFGVDLGRMLADSLGITDLAAFDDIDLMPYRYDEVMEFETERHQAHERMLSDIREAFTTQPTLRISNALASGPMQINPARNFPITGLGTAHGGPTVIISGDFGYLTVYDGFFVRRDGANDGMVVATDMITDGNRFTAPGWILELNSGFRLRNQSGHYIVERE